MKEYFPDIYKKTKFSEEGIELFEKLSIDINKKGEKEAKKNEATFKEKKPKTIKKDIRIINSKCLFY